MVYGLWPPHVHANVDWNHALAVKLKKWLKSSKTPFKECTLAIFCVVSEREPVAFRAGKTSSFVCVTAGHLWFNISICGFSYNFFSIEALSLVNTIKKKLKKKNNLSRPWKNNDKPSAGGAPPCLGEKANLCLGIAVWGMPEGFPNVGRVLQTHAVPQQASGMSCLRKLRDRSDAKA